jgi:hypothetical protein
MGSSVITFAGPVQGSLVAQLCYRLVGFVTAIPKTLSPRRPPGRSSAGLRVCRQPTVENVSDPWTTCPSRVRPTSTAEVAGEVLRIREVVRRTDSARAETDRRDVEIPNVQGLAAEDDDRNYARASGVDRLGPDVDGHGRKRLQAEHDANYVFPSSDVARQVWEAAANTESRLESAIARDVRS